MNWRKIWQKAKDLYGWDQGNLFYFKDKREYQRCKVEYYKEKIAKAKSQKEYNKWLYHLEGAQAEFDRCDFYVRSHGEDTDPNWRNRD